MTTDFVMKPPTCCQEHLLSERLGESHRVAAEYSRSSSGNAGGASAVSTATCSTTANKCH